MNTHIKINRNALKSILRQRVDFLRPDFETFLWLRTDGRASMDRNRLGGGNLLILLGEFAILNLIAKTYKVLRTGASLLRSDSDDALEALRTCQIEYPALRAIRVSNWEVSERNAFIGLARDYPLDFGLGQDREHIGRAWDRIRNKLSHMATLEKDTVAVALSFSEDITYKDAKDAIRVRTQPSFEHRGETLLCYVDLLNDDLERITDWICHDVEAGRFDPNLEDALMFLEEEG